MSKLLLALLRRFLTLGAGEDAADDPPEDGGDALDDLIDDADDPAKEASTDDPPEKPAPPSKRERELEQDLERERTRTRELETRYAPPARSAADPEADREQAEIDAARKSGNWNEESIKWLERQHTVARSARAAERNSQSALAEARDISDKTRFDQMAVTKPGLHKKFSADVERMYAEQKSRGTPVSREVIFDLLIGRAVRTGDVKTKTKAAPAGGNKVDRGRTPGVRSDVNGKGGGKNEREARRERLRNMNI